MMRHYHHYYAHRGNLEGRIAERENQPDYIDEAIDAGYDVEVDLWKVGDRIYLGHDDGQYDVTYDWLRGRKYYVLYHAKNREAFDYALRNDFHTFWHTDEDYVITSMGHIVGYPGKISVGHNFLLSVPERAWPLDEIKQYITFGLISDYVKTLNNG